MYDERKKAKRRGRERQKKIERRRERREILLSI